MPDEARIVYLLMAAALVAPAAFAIVKRWLNRKR
jgi:hypothetical protein